MAAGFISFPILTRVFSVEEYGVLGLISTTLLISMSIAKSGFPSSIVRFHAEFGAAKKLDNFYSTVLLASVGLSVAVALLLLIITELVLKYFWGSTMIRLIPIVSLLIIIGCTTDIITSALRAEQATKMYNFIAIIRRYISLALGIFFVFYFVKGLYGFFVGQVISGILTLVVLLFYFRKKLKLKPSNFSSEIFKTTLKYGFPLIWVELGALVLNYADRYLIQIYLGATSLGIYTAGYNLATYVNDIMIYSISYAMTPIYMNILVNKGEQETKKFFTKTFRYYLLAMFPVVFGFIAVGPDLLVVLASRKYTGASVILPYIVIGQLIHSSAIILNSGLFIGKKTHLLGFVTLLACLVNVALNLILIPYNGIVGSAQATVISYLFFTALITYFAFKEFSFHIDYQHILLYLVGSIVMFVILNLIDIGSSLSNLLIKIPLGAVLYSFFIMFFDKDIRYFVSSMRTKQGISNIRNSSS
jgi:O-antigen/teichoic acid export membrane protein